MAKTQKQWESIKRNWALKTLNGFLGLARKLVAESQNNMGLSDAEKDSFDLKLSAAVSHIWWAQLTIRQANQRIHIENVTADSDKEN